MKKINKVLIVLCIAILGLGLFLNSSKDAIANEYGLFFPGYYGFHDDLYCESIPLVVLYFDYECDASEYGFSNGYLSLSDPDDLCFVLDFREAIYCYLPDYFFYSPY